MKGYEWVDAVLSHSRAEGLDRLLLVTLASRANPAGECWPSLADLVARTRLARRTVIYAVHRLEGLGELHAIPGRGRGHTTRYRLSDALRGAPHGGEKVHGVHPSREMVHGVHPSNQRKGASDDTKRCILRPEKVHPGAPGTGIEPIREPARARALQREDRARAEPETDEEQNTTVRPLDLFQAALARLAAATGRAPPTAAATAPPAKVDAKA
jgi:Helix-turn-helix domain